MAKVTVRRGDSDGVYAGTAGEFRISIDRTESRVPRSIDLVLLGLGACTISTVAHFMERKGLPQDHLAVELSAELDEKENRYTDFKLVLRVDDRIPPELRKALVNVAKTCRIHRTLASAPHVAVALAEPAATSVS
jgi:putative redox protein